MPFFLLEEQLDSLVFCICDLQHGAMTGRKYSRHGGFLYKFKMPKVVCLTEMVDTIGVTVV